MILLSAWGIGGIGTGLELGAWVSHRVDVGAASLLSQRETALLSALFVYESPIYGPPKLRDNRSQK